MWHRLVGWILIGLAGALALLPGAVIGGVRLWWRLTDPERFESTYFIVKHHWWAWGVIIGLLLAGSLLIWRAQTKN